LEFSTTAPVRQINSTDTSGIEFMEFEAMPEKNGSVEKSTVEYLKRKAEKPGRDAMILHPFYRGKVATASKVPVRTFDDFAIWYTPGVAKACLAIKDNLGT